MLCVSACKVHRMHKFCIHNCMEKHIHPIDYDKLSVRKYIQFTVDADLRCSYTSSGDQKRKPCKEAC